MHTEDQNTLYNNGPVFIVGMNGSGTTMLAECLGNHPDLYIFPQESRVIPYFIYKKHEFGDLTKLSARRKLARALGRSWAFRFVNDKKPLVLEDKYLSQPGFSGVVDSLFRYFAESEGKSRWGEKTPMYVQHISLLASQFPNAKFIHIYRDGRDVAQSFHRRYKKQPYWTIYRWKKVIEMGRFQGEKIGNSRYKEICYETLTEKPEDVLKEVCHFLNLQYYDSICRTSSRHMDSKEKIDTIVNNSEKWKWYFSDKMSAKLESIAGKFLSDLGYRIYFIKGDKDPSKWLISWWKFVDQFQITLNLFRSRGGIRYIPKFTRKALYVRKQNKTNFY